MCFNSYEKYFFWGGDCILKVVSGAGLTCSYSLHLHCPNSAVWKLGGLALQQGKWGDIIINIKK